MTTLDIPPASAGPAPPPAAPALPTEYAALADRLDSVGGRFRLAFTLRGLAQCILLLTPLSLAILFAAGFFPLAAWFKVFLILLWMAALVASYARFLHRPLFHQPSYAEIARLIEQNATRVNKQGQPILAGLDNALINAVLLAQEIDTASAVPHARTAPQQLWIPHVLREAGRAIADVPLEKTVPWGQPAKAISGALLLVICAAGLVAFAPSVFAHGWSVLLRPTAFVPHQGLVRIVGVTPGNDTALLGQALFFTVTVETPDHKTIDAQLQITTASGKVLPPLPMLPFGTENTQYNRQGVLATEDLDYIITAGDTQSEKYHITVLPQIHLTDYALDIAPPAYTGKPHQTIHLTGKAAQTGAGGATADAARAPAEAPLGSDIALSIALDGPAREVLLDVAGQSPVSMSPQGDGRTFATRFPLRDTLRYTIRVNDGANRTLHQFPDSSDSASNKSDTPTGVQAYYTLTATPDAPPTITVTDPGRDTDAKPDGKLELAANATDDYGIASIRLEIAKNNEQEFHTLATVTPKPGATPDANRALTYHHTFDFAKDSFKFGDTLRYRVIATDNRNLTALDPSWTAQSAASPIFTVTFSDKALAAAQSGRLWEQLRAKLTDFLEREVALRKASNALVTGMSIDDIRKTTAPIHAGQQSLRADMLALVRDFPFEPSMKLVQKSLEVLTVEDAASAIDRGADILLLSDNRSLPPLATKLRQNQSHIIDVLQTLLAIIAAQEERIASTADHEGGDLPLDGRAAWKNLADDLKKFEDQQKKVIDASADLAKKPKADFNADDQKKLDELKAIEDQWEKFMNERLADMSRLAEQDQANASLAEEMVKMKVELATAAKALEAKAANISVPVEESALENAETLTTHIERMLSQAPDRTQWQMEDPLTQNDPKMAELPQQLQDMVGDLMDKEEDLTDQMESQASKFADSIDKGAGWDAMDGPISNMSAQGVTGNQLPKDMEIQGRSGEGREGRASGEMVGSTAEGKEGRRTPTRLTPDPFSNSQVDDKSTLPEGGATGGGKKAGAGTEGLEGPAPQDDPNFTQRLAGQQAAIRNEAERLALQMHAAQFDNFKLLESNAYLKKSEDALKQYHYQNALYYQEKAVEALNTAKVLASGQIHVITDTSPTASTKTQKEIESALNGPLPRGYADPVKAYFEKLSNENLQP